MRYHSIRIAHDIFCCPHPIFLHSDSLFHFGYIYLATDHLRIWSCYRIVTDTIVVISIILVYHSPPPSPALGDSVVLELLFFEFHCCCHGLFHPLGTVYR